MSSPKCYFVGHLPTGVPKPVLEFHFQHIYFTSISKYSVVKVVVIQCVEDTVPLEAPFTCFGYRLKTKIIYTLEQFNEFFANYSECLEYSPNLNLLYLTSVSPVFNS